MRQLQCYTIRKEVSLLAEIEITFTLLRNPKHMPEVEGWGGDSRNQYYPSIIAIRFNPKRTLSFVNCWWLKELIRWFEVAVAAGLKVLVEWPPPCQSSRLRVVGQSYRDAFQKEEGIAPSLYIPLITNIKRQAKKECTYCELSAPGT